MLSTVRHFQVSPSPAGNKGKHFVYETKKLLCLDTPRKRRSHGFRIMNAATPTMEDAVVAAAPVTKEDLVNYLASGCKPKDKWRIGTEHEKFGFEIGTLRPINYEKIATFLNRLADRFGWERMMEGDLVIGLKQGKQTITLEAGGQVELSGAPLETLHQTRAEVIAHLNQVKLVGEEMGIGFLGMGFQPKSSADNTPYMPKERYVIFGNNLEKIGWGVLDVLARTCSVQVNLDHSSEADMVRKFRASLALQPIITAMFANSPFEQGKPNGYLSLRSYSWSGVVERNGMLPFVFEDSFGFERYVEYALDVPMLFAYRNKKHIDCCGMSFRDFLEGKLPACPGELPTISDWEIHLGSLYPGVRLKKYLEMRDADIGPLSRLCALPALWVGLLYDEDSLQKVVDMTSDWTEKEREMLRFEVTKQGMKTPFRGGSVRDVAEVVLKLAKDGLERRGFNEVGFLSDLDEVVSSGVTPAERLLEKYYGKWGQNVDVVFKEPDLLL